MANQGGGNSVLIRDYRKGNWTVQETMVLIEAKKMDDERRSMKRISSVGETSNSSEEAHGMMMMMVTKSKPAELRWKWVEDYCWRNGCLRSQNQCNDKWDNLMRDFKKVRDYEGRRDQDHGHVSSYWKIEKHERKQKNLPSNMLPEIFQALVEVVERRESGPPTGVAASGRGSGGGGYVAVERSSGGKVVQRPDPSVLQHYPVISSGSLPVLPLHPPALPPPLLPPPPAPAAPLHALPHSDQPLPTVDSGDTSDHSDSPATKRRKRRGNATTTSPTEVLGSAISKSASIIVEAIQASEARQEKRHRDLLSLQERRLEMEESKSEITRQGINGLVDAINKLANSILALAASNNNQTTTSTTPK